MVITNEANSVVIPRAEAFLEKFNARMKFLLGDNVRVGAEYYGWESLDDHRYDGSCQVVHFDGAYLYVFEKGKEAIALLYGDAADYKGQIIADRYFASYNICKMQERVEQYMRKKAIEAYDSEVGYHALWVKMVPSSYIQRIVKVYELGRGLIEAI